MYYLKSKLIIYAHPKISEGQYYSERAALLSASQNGSYESTGI